MVSQPSPGVGPTLRRGVAVFSLLSALSVTCAHAGTAAGEAPKTMNEARPQPPPVQASEVKTVDVTIREERIDAVDEVAAGGLTFSFFNASGRPSTAAIEGKGGPWRIERPIPHDRSMTLEVMLEPGDYVLVCQPEGKASLTAVVRATQPTPARLQVGSRQR